METENRKIIQSDGDWFIGWSLFDPGADDHGRTIDDCCESIDAAIELALEDKQQYGRN